jgi:hypothetical protein
MKMVKSLLLGSAAGVVAMAGAQAADLPVKAKPVQYVKICSLYGAGFYYIPGTDTCLKIGGWTRLYVGEGLNGNFTSGALGTAAVNTRATENFVYRTRGYITADARTQTEWGTLRSYLAVGYSAGGANGGTTGGITNGNITGVGNTNAAYDPANGAAGFNSNRAFIQIAGFTFGVSQSFYDLYPTPALSYYGGSINPSSDTGDGGKLVMSYTAQFGGGFSASIGGEAQRNSAVIGPASSFASVLNNGVGSASFIGGPPSSAQEATQWPDIVGNLRLDAAWGSAQVMGAIHDVSGTYVGANTTSAAGPNTIGWAVGAGVKFFVPMAGPGDYFSAQINYAQGASGYVDNPNATLFSAFNGGSGYGFGIQSDNVWTAAGGSNLTTMWGVNAGYEHFWTKRWQTSVYGMYMAQTYNATANAALCTLEGSGSTSGMYTLAGGGVGCNNNWSYWDIGTRTQFNIDSQTYVGLDVIYTKLGTASSGLVVPLNGLGTQPASTRTLADQSAWSAEFRIHRNFYP